MALQSPLESVELFIESFDLHPMAIAVFNDGYDYMDAIDEENGPTGVLPHGWTYLEDYLPPLETLQSTIRYLAAAIPTLCRVHIIHHAAFPECEEVQFPAEVYFDLVNLSASIRPVVECGKSCGREVEFDDKTRHNERYGAMMMDLDWVWRQAVSEVIYAGTEGG